VHDLRSFIRLLKESGELRTVSQAVDPRFEMSGVMGKLEQERKAFYFAKVKGAEFPAVGGLFNKLERFGMALGHDFASPFTHEAFDAMLEKAKARPVDPTIVASGPVKQVIKTGEEVNLHALPVPTFFELDSGPFITAAVGISRDPETGVQNIGVYRTLITGRNEFVINASSLSDLRVIYKKWEALGEPMPIALAIGVDPAMLTAGACKLPPSVSEYGIAGALQGKPVELVKCETSDLTVPATAEFIIEGTVDFSRRVENLLGEFAGQYGPENAPITTVNAITHRSDAIFYSIMAGRNPEHNTLGNVAVYGVQRSISSALQAAIPEIRNMHVFMDPGLGTLAHVVISIDKKSDAQPKDIIEKTFQTGGHIFPVSMITKRVIIVDEDIDVKNFADVQWAIWNRAATERKFIVIPDVQSWELERAAKEGMKSVRIGIDATMDLEDVEKLVRPVTPGADKICLEDYVDETRENAA
jgi:2,5-furandicarboxylate decarboxylase 1